MWASKKKTSSRYRIDAVGRGKPTALHSREGPKQLQPEGIRLIREGLRERITGKTPLFRAGRLFEIRKGRKSD